MPMRMLMLMPTLNLYLDKRGSADLEAFRTLAARRGLSLSEAVRELIARELAADSQDFLAVDDAARRRDDRS
jgi:hypothetical protein